MSKLLLFKKILFLYLLLLGRSKSLFSMVLTKFVLFVVVLWCFFSGGSLELPTLLFCWHYSPIVFLFDLSLSHVWSVRSFSNWSMSFFNIMLWFFIIFSLSCMIRCGWPRILDAPVSFDETQYFKSTISVLDNLLLLVYSMFLGLFQNKSGEEGREGRR